MPNSRTARWLAGGVALTLFLAACGSPKSGSKELEKIRFTEVIHSVFYLPQYVAQAKGFFKDEGIDLEASTAQGSDRGTAALLAGTADVALVGPETTIFVKNQEGSSKVRMFAQLTAKDGSFLLARGRKAPFSWADLQGKAIIGWRPGSMPQLVAAATLRKQGIDPDKGVNYISNLAAPAMAGAFQSGQADYLQVFEPVASQLEKSGTAHVVAYIGDVYGEVAYTGFVATEKFIKEKPEAVQRYTNAIYRAMRYVQETDEKVIAKEIAPLFEGSDVDLLAAAIRRYREGGAWTKSPVMQPAPFEKLQELMVEGGVLEANKRVKFEEITTNQFAEAAVKAGGKR